MRSRAQTAIKSAPTAKASLSATSASKNRNSWATRCALVSAPHCRGISWPADYGRVAIDLAGGYAAGLGADAQIIVEVNGRSAGSVRLSSANGENFLHKRHFLPLSAFRPGQNRIELRVNAPDGAAVGCDTSGRCGPPCAECG